MAEWSKAVDLSAPAARQARWDYDVLYWGNPREFEPHSCQHCFFAAFGGLGGGQSGGGDVGGRQVRKAVYGWGKNGVCMADHGRFFWRRMSFVLSYYFDDEMECSWFRMY